MTSILEHQAETQLECLILWLNFDPTNRIDSGFDLIPVAIARHPEQAVPLEGSWFGSAQDYLGMSVEVQVRKVATLAIEPLAVRS